MTALICWCLAVAHDDAACCRDRWPSSSVAVDQREYCRRHIRWLREQERLHGWRDGRYRQWIAETEFRATFYVILADWTRYDDRRNQMIDLIGWQRFAAGWHPPYMYYSDHLYPEYARPAMPRVLPNPNEVR